MKINIAENDLAEFVGEIIDIFEDFLDERGVVLDNPDRDAENEDGCCANIYGMDYGNLSEDIEKMLNLWKEK